MKEYSSSAKVLHWVARGPATEQTHSFWKVTLKNSMFLTLFIKTSTTIIIFNVCCWQYKGVEHFLSEIVDSTMKNHYFWVNMYEHIVEID